MPKQIRTLDYEIRNREDGQPGVHVACTETYTDESATPGYTEFPVRGGIADALRMITSRVSTAGPKCKTVYVNAELNED